ncbi:Kinase superfamily protein [Rhynchospora pubera]|uniref:Kinase superfamily protein n=1 Tax=Rhynchospora pubera TaxID=906938 RepID=A0AAV8DL89_9POAL|nr:Kinase superfamily protein [Rhynchospora pubera]
MNCLSCFSSSEKEGERERGREKDERNAATTSAGTNTDGSSSTDARASSSAPPGNSSAQASNTVPNIAMQKFTFQELEIATKLFLDECVIGEGGFGKVYKGTLERTGQDVAVKKLNLDGAQGSTEFLNEVSMLSHLQHSNLVNLVGYCSEGDQNLLVYEYMPSGSVEDHLFDLKTGQQPLDWFTRMRIAHGVAEGLNYLHHKVDPPVIFRDLKASNILLDGNINGLAKIGPVGNNTKVSTMIAGTDGYCAPEYETSDQLTVKSDVYSFGVVLLELISGRRAFDDAKPINEKSLAVWAKPMLRDETRYRDLIDPSIKTDYPPEGLNRAVEIAAMCLQQTATDRPRMCDMARALEPLIVPDVEKPFLENLMRNEMSASEGSSPSGSHNE